MNTITDRVLPVTITVCAAAFLLTIVACVVVAAWLDLRVLWRMVRPRRRV